MAKKEYWYWTIEEIEDWYGPFPTKKEAIAGALEHALYYGWDPSIDWTIEVGRLVHPDPIPYFLEVCDLKNLLFEAEHGMAEDGGPEAPPPSDGCDDMMWSVLSEQAKREWETVVLDWARKFLKAPWFMPDPDEKPEVIDLKKERE